MNPGERPAVVTGASSGIGEAIARSLAAAGHPVVLGARRAERCDAIANEVNEAGGRAVAIALDVADDGSSKDFVAAAGSAFGPIEVLISNAGESWPGTGAGTSPEEFARTIEINLLGAQRLVSMIVPGMVERGRGDVVFLTSDSVRVPWPGVASYVSSKWGLEGLARAMQLELEGTGVRASIVRPGPTATEMGTRWDRDAIGGLVEGFKRWGVLRHGRLLTPEQVAAVVAHIVATPPGAHITLVDLQPEAPRAGGDTE